MSISINPSISLQAQSAYGATNAQKTSLPERNDLQATQTFQAMVKQNFNSFANMKPEQILAVVKQTQATGTYTAPTTSALQQAFSSIPNALRKDEDVKRRSIINEASMSEVIAAASEAKNVLQTAVAVRNKVLDAFDKIMNMPL